MKSMVRRHCLTQNLVLRAGYFSLVHAGLTFMNRMQKKAAS